MNDNANNLLIYDKTILKHWFSLLDCRKQKTSNNFKA